jgi:AAA+ ATPase superfamily predicted ATPase
MFFMNKTIIGREQEIQYLNKLMLSGRPEFLVVYGRRRVGKTFLINEHLGPEIVFSFSGSYNVPAKVQIGNFFSEYLRITKGQHHTTPPVDWSMAFSYLTDYLYSLHTTKGTRAVVFIDELPWLDTPKSGFVPALEYFWNQHASKMNHVLLIACGSVASWMIKKLLKSKGGLYNRVTARLKLEPFSLGQTAAYCQQKGIKLSHYQIVQLYMAMGGIPFYLNALEPGISVVQLIDEICFSTTGLLADEYEKMYYSLFKNAENHLAIIEALAKHPYGMIRGALMNASGLPPGGTFARTLEELLDNGFIIKLHPFQKKEKESIYRLIDMYSLFYLRFIRGNAGRAGVSWQLLSADSSYTIWSGYAYENICLLHTKQILKKLGLSGTLTRISSWYFKGTDELPGAQIDVMIDRKDGMINLCEVKFSNKEFVITKEYAAKLRQKSSIFESVTQTKKTVIQTLISTYAAMQNVHYLENIQSEVCMDDLFEAN